MNEKYLNDATRAILQRRTVRAYTRAQVPDDMLEALLEAAKWAPSGRNSQPCHVRVLQDAAALEQLNTDFKNLVGWDTPAYTRWDVNPVYQTAPTLIFVYTPGDSAMDAGLLTENICIAAQSLGLGTCIIGSVGALMNAPAGQTWKERLHVPADWRFQIAIAVGFPAEEPPVKPREDGHFEIIRKVSL